MRPSVARLTHAAILALTLSACSFTRAALYPREPATVQLSPKMAALDEGRSVLPFVADSLLFMGGWVAGPVSHNERVNLGGLVVSGVTLLSLALTVAIWGEL